jgi:hypothetical protein
MKNTTAAIFNFFILPSQAAEIYKEDAKQRSSVHDYMYPKTKINPNLPFFMILSSYDSVSMVWQ